MIVVKLIGGLGNQLFQYACGYSVALKLNTELKIDISGFDEYKLHEFALDNFAITSLKADKSDLPYLKYYKESSLNYEPEVFELGDDLYLDGYWGSEKYFQSNRNLILREFQIIHPAQDDNLIFLELINSKNSVSIHVRRGDYVLNTYKEQLLEVCDLEYYQRSIDYFNKTGNDYSYFVFTDDKEWVKENFKFKGFDYTLVEHNGSDKNFEDLRLMSACKHNIIANSTFSWWAAWLNRNKNKIVVAPINWYSQKMKTKIVDLIPQSWLLF